MIDRKKLEGELWDIADTLRANSKLTANEYCMPILGLIFLKYINNKTSKYNYYSQMAENKNLGNQIEIWDMNFWLSEESAEFQLSNESRYEYLSKIENNVGLAVNHGMELIEKYNNKLKGILPKNYDIFDDNILNKIINIFNQSYLDDVDGDIIGRIYEYFLGKFAQSSAQDQGVFFTPVSIVQLMVNIIEPNEGVLLDPACGSGGMFVQTDYFLNKHNETTSHPVKFYGQEKAEVNYRLAMMNMAIHNLDANIKIGNSFYEDVHKLEGKCDYVMANPPFNVDKINAEATICGGRLPFGLPSVNKMNEISNGNYVWLQYVYSYLNSKGRGAVVMASSSLDSGFQEQHIREQMIETNHIDVVISVGGNFFYTKTIPCCIWFFDKNKNLNIKNKILMIDGRNIYSQIGRTLNQWTKYQLQNIKATVNLYRGDTEKYTQTMNFYISEYDNLKCKLIKSGDNLFELYSVSKLHKWKELFGKVKLYMTKANGIQNMKDCLELLQGLIDETKETNKYLKSEISNKTENKDCFIAICKALKLENVNAFQTRQELMKVSSKFVDDINNLAECIQEYFWLYDKFETGKYKDISGFCKIICTSDTENKNYSLNPGSYVGTTQNCNSKSDDLDAEISNIHKTLYKLQIESDELMSEILGNFKELKI